MVGPFGDAILDLPDNTPELRQEVLRDLQLFDCYEKHEVSVPSLEAKATQARAHKDFSHDTCAEIVRELCEKWGSEAQRQAMKVGKTIVLGAYSFSVLHGITNRTHVFSEVTRYFNSYPKHLGAQGRWSSLSIALNTKPTIHRDSHNWSIEDNMIVSIGSHTGGRLWVEEDNSCKDESAYPGAHEIQLSNGKKLNGRFLDLKEKLSYFDPSKRHFAEDWTGERMTITAYGV